MDIHELQPIIDLITLQEERLAKKIDEVHDDVKETRDQAKKTNGRVTQAEKDILLLQTQFESKREECKKKFDSIDPTISTVKFINFLTNKPKFSIVLFIGTIVIIQTIVLEATQNNWLKSFIDLIIP
jgi:peptidoglycan hydrolase CwlO-like protein